MSSRNHGGGGGGGANSLACQWPPNTATSRQAERPYERRYLLVEQFHEAGEQLAFAAFQQQIDLLVDVALMVHGHDGVERPLPGQSAAGSEAAVKLVEIRLRPAGEQRPVAVDDLFDHRIGIPIEPAMRQQRRILKQLIRIHAQPGRQPMQRAGMRFINPRQNALERPFIEPGTRDQILQRKALAIRN